MFWPVFMFDNFLAVFMFLGRFPFEFFGHYVEYLRQFLPFLANLKVNFYNWQSCTQQSYATKNICYKLGICLFILYTFIIDNIAVQKLIYKLC